MQIDIRHFSRFSAFKTLSSSEGSLKNYVEGAAFLSRWVDCTISIILLILTAPILAAASLAIKIENPHAPVFFRQTRYGYMGRPFTMYKLRTMVPEAETLKGQFIALSEDKGPGFKLEHDPRVTKIGRVFRKFYIDEIPQFLNVLRGDMALVGPRANSYRPESYEPWQRIRLAVKPGLTGSWQVARNKPTRFDDRCRMDIDYMNRKSMFFDAILMIRTGIMILTGASGK